MAAVFKIAALDPTFVEVSGGPSLGMAQCRAVRFWDFQRLSGMSHALISALRELRIPPVTAFRKSPDSEQVHAAIQWAEQQWLYNIPGTLRQPARFTDFS